MNLSSKHLEKAVEEIAGLPGIGKKTALRLALHLLKQEERQVYTLSKALTDLKDKVQYCRSCGNLSDHNLCDICTNPARQHDIICVVEDIRDVMAIENTGQYRGVYQVLGGVISPMEGIGPSDLNIDSLIQKTGEGKVKEVIMALGTTMEGETTAFFLYRKLQNSQVLLSSIARGVAMGDQLEYTDEVTLARSILNRIPYENALNQNQKTRD